MTDWLRRLLFRLDGRRAAIERYTKGLQQLARPPYDLAIYAECVAAVAEGGFTTPAFTEQSKSKNVASVYFRHDIDLAECPIRLPSLIKIEQRFGIRSGVYFQANDNAPYDLREFRSLANDLASEGVEVGLHTVCYVENARWDALRVERGRFADALGFLPSSVNAHGLGEFRWRERVAFYREATADRLRAEGFRFSDMSYWLRSYDHVAEDCHSNPKSKPNHRIDGPLAPGSERFLKDDFLGLANVRGARFLVLTHPGYWGG